LALGTWHLQDATFNDGGTASGFFVYDTQSRDPNTLLDSYDIMVTGGSTRDLPPFRYQASGLNVKDSRSNEEFLDIETGYPQRRLTLFFARPLPENGGTVHICGWRIASLTDHIVSRMKHPIWAACRSVGA
jgi:hypothetical protein